MAVWRVTLPDYPDNLGYALREGAIESPNESGPSNKRPRFTREGAILTYARIFNGTQLLDLLDYHDNELAQGAITFTRDDPIDDVVRTMRFKQRPQFVLVRGGPVPANRLWRVTITIYILVLSV